MGLRRGWPGNRCAKAKKGSGVAQGTGRRWVVHPPPNKALQPTAYSVRSCTARASGSG